MADLNPGFYHCRVCAHLAPPGTGEHICMPVSSRPLFSCCFLSLQPDCQLGEGRPRVLLFCNPRSRAHPADLPLLDRTSLPSGCLLVHLFCPRPYRWEAGQERGWCGHSWAYRGSERPKKCLKASPPGSSWGPLEVSHMCTPLSWGPPGPPLAASPGLFLMC